MKQLKRHSLYFILCLLFTGFVAISQHANTLLFIGTYTQGQPDTGIYICSFNSKSGEIKQLSTANDLVNPSFLNLSPNGKYLYACTNSKLPEHGKVAAFYIDSLKGRIQTLNSQSSLGENPVYVNVHPNGTFIVNANYTEGNISVYASTTNGLLSIPIQSMLFTDSSIIHSRQDKSHIHAAVFSPDGDYLILPDLGADKIRVLKLDIQKEKTLVEKVELTVKCIPGSGPRHFVFHPGGKWAYCIEELSGYISAYTYTKGQLTAIQRIFSYSKPHDAFAAADIHISPDGAFLYASNRIENTLSIFHINVATGQLELVGHQVTFGDHPRNFTIDPSGNFLLVANLGSNSIIVFKRDIKTGLLSKTKHEFKVPRPSCLHMRNYIK